LCDIDQNAITNVETSTVAGATVEKKDTDYEAVTPVAAGSQVRTII